MEWSEGLSVKHSNNEVARTPSTGHGGRCGIETSFHNRENREMRHFKGSRLGNRRSGFWIVEMEIGVLHFWRRGWAVDSPRHADQLRPEMAWI